MMQTVQALRETVNQSIEDLEVELDTLRKIRATIDGDNNGHVATNGNGHPEGSNGAAAAAPKAQPTGRRMARVRKRPLADRVLTMVKGHPEGVPISEIADQCKTATSYVYAVARKLQDAGTVERRNGRIFPKAKVAASNTQAT